MAVVEQPVVVAPDRRASIPLVALGILTGAVWLALLRLGWAFFTESLDWRYVAEQTRIGAPWPYRVAGVWGGMEGSLLLFAGIVGVAATSPPAGRRRRCAGRRWSRWPRSSPSTSSWRRRSGASTSRPSAGSG